MDLIPSLVPGVLALLGVVVGAALHYSFTRAAEKEKQARTLRADAYAAYLQVIGESEQLKRLHPSSERVAEIRAAAIYAKARVCVLGSAKVVRALAAFEDNPTAGLTPAKKTALVALLDAMRDDLATGRPVSPNSINKILFMPDASTQKQVVDSQTTKS
jgi:hypothetical protein